MDGAIVLGGYTTHAEASKNCSEIGEELLDTKSIQTPPLLDYLIYLNYSTPQELFWVTNKTDDQCQALSGAGELAIVECEQHLQALCSSTAPIANIADQDTSDQWRFGVNTQGQTIKGYRDKRSFRFFGIRYANKPVRFAHSILFNDTGSYDAINPGPVCMQSGDGDMSEDCLFLNVWTPYLPHDGSTSRNLKPVLFWMHGGAFEGDSGSDPTFDGGNQASRGDIVVVTINYRLGNLGFLPIQNTTATGNYGFGDQIIALDWVQQHISDFGGDPDRVTIAGQSAGAASVRAMLGSSKAHGKFAAAIMQSNLGGYDFARSYSQYYAIEDVQKNFTDNILAQVSCDGRNSLSCMQKTDPGTIVGAQQAAFLVQDGVYITNQQLMLNGSAIVAHVPVMMGTMQGDAVFFIAPAPENPTNLSLALEGAGWNNSVINNPTSFPVFNTSSNSTNLYNVTVNAANDAMFRCVDQATAASGIKNDIFPNVWYYEMERSYIDYPTRPACNAPIGPGFPFGNPKNQTYDCHTGDTVYTFGNVGFAEKPDRDGQDILFSQLVTDAWSSFIRSHDPNPDPDYLKARGYIETINSTNIIGPWKAVNSTALSKRLLSAKSTDVGFTEIQQCADLELPIDMFD